MDSFSKKRRDTSRSAAERRTTQALKAVGPTIASCNARLARCRAVAALSKPGYAQEILAECSALRSTLTAVRTQLQQIIEALPGDQRGHSRVRDMRLALDTLDGGVEEIAAQVVAASSELANDNARWSASTPRLREGSPQRDRQGGIAT